MTETHTLDEAISEALAVIDKGLGDLLHRELVSSTEVADLLLDVRRPPGRLDPRRPASLLANPGSGSDERDDFDVPVPG